jgi:hypothetical protein
VDCNPCPHGKVKHNCGDCKPCPHGKRKSDCAHCNPCPHGKLKRRCVDCRGEYVNPALLRVKDARPP